MALIEQDVIVTTKYGKMPSFAAAPADGGPAPAVIFYMDAPGIREELRNMARRIAKAGYFCLLPDMYYRLGTIRFDVARRSDGMGKAILASMDHLSNDMVMDDTAGMLAWLDAQDQVKAGPVGCVGYCMSGRHITNAAALYPHRIKAAASFYGVDIVTEDENSPHLRLDQVQGELYFGFAETDHTVPDHVISALKDALDETGTNYALDVYPGTAHGFCFPERQVYVAKAAEEAWEKQLALWQRNLT